MNSQHPLIRALADVSFSPGTANKRFVRDIAARSAEFELSARAEAYVWRIGYRMRRQLCAALAAEVVARKVDHVWHAEGSHDAPPGSPHMRCANCRGAILWGAWVANETEAEEFVWLRTYRYSIARSVEWLEDPNILRQIAELIGWKEPGKPEKKSSWA